MDIYIKEAPLNTSSLCEGTGYGRQVLAAYNEGRHNGVEIDLLELIDWLKKNKPELLQSEKQCPSS
jgi:hypothetical protein